MMRSPCLYLESAAVKRKVVTNGAISYQVSVPYMVNSRMLIGQDLISLGLTLSDRAARIRFMVPVTLTEGDHVHFTDRSGVNWVMTVRRYSGDAFTAEGQLSPA